MVVGLGNPGSKYAGTRHNVGFDVLDKLCSMHAGSSLREAFSGKLASVEIEGNKLLLVWPQTYMNLSGRCVSAVVGYYKIDARSDLLIVCDDLSLPLGKIRIRGKGSAGGQKGLADILSALASQEVPRLRIGIDPSPPKWEAADYVLSRFRVHERDIIEQSIERACTALEAWCVRDLQFCMNQFNQ